MQRARIGRDRAPECRAAPQRRRPSPPPYGDPRPVVPVDGQARGRPDVPRPVGRPGRGVGRPASRSKGLRRRLSPFGTSSWRCCSSRDAAPSWQGARGAAAGVAD